MELKELEQLIKTRRSVRRWQNKPIPEELLVKAVELATWAPSAGNSQNWRFYIVMGQQKMKEIAGAVQATADLIASWPEAQGNPILAGGRKAGYFEAAPAAILVAASRRPSPVDGVFEVREKIDPRAKEIRQWRAISASPVQGVAAAIATLLLVLHQMGLGAVWMTGPMQAKGELEKILKVPPEFDLIALLPVGYPDETPVSRGRKPVSEVTEIVK
jgi:nitroreductase